MLIREDDSKLARTESDPAKSQHNNIAPTANPVRKDSCDVRSSRAI
jgi:hypothetical protein